MAPSVLFIAGIHRSGTTLAARLLGEIEGFFCAGEVNAAWGSDMCACGRPVDECPVWSAVLARAFVGTHPPDRREILALQAHIRSRPVQLLNLIRQGRHPTDDHPVRRYGEILRRIFVAIHEVTGADVVVDSTKSPNYAYVTAKFTGLPVSILHLVRDPRAVAYSLLRQPLDPRKAQGYPEILGPVVSSGRWLVWQALTETLASAAVHGRYRRMCYEDLVRAPTEALFSACQLVGVADRDLPQFLTSDTANLTESHIVSGNRGRCRVGPTTIRLDDEWRTCMKPLARTLATLPALPLLPHYGYGLLASRRAVSPSAFASQQRSEGTSASTGRASAAQSLGPVRGTER
jgi:hypothetical protein